MAPTNRGVQKHAVGRLPQQHQQQHQQLQQQQQQPQPFTDYRNAPAATPLFSANTSSSSSSTPAPQTPSNTMSNANFLPFNGQSASSPMGMRQDPPMGMMMPNVMNMNYFPQFAQQSPNPQQQAQHMMYSQQNGNNFALGMNQGMYGHAQQQPSPHQQQGFMQQQMGFGMNGMNPMGMGMMSPQFFGGMQPNMAFNGMAPQNMMPETANISGAQASAVEESGDGYQPSGASETTDDDKDKDKDSDDSNSKSAEDQMYMFINGDGDGESMECESYPMPTLTMSVNGATGSGQDSQELSPSSPNISDDVVTSPSEHSLPPKEEPLSLAHSLSTPIPTPSLQYPVSPTMSSLKSPTLKSPTHASSGSNAKEKEQNKQKLYRNRKSEFTKKMQDELLSMNMLPSTRITHAPEIMSKTADTLRDYRELLVLIRDKVELIPNNLSLAAVPGAVRKLLSEDGALFNHAHQHPPALQIQMPAQPQQPQPTHGFRPDLKLPIQMNHEASQPIMHPLQQAPGQGFRY